MAVKKKSLLSRKDGKGSHPLIQQGPQRPFYKAVISPEVIKTTTFNKYDFYSIASLFILTLSLRIFKISSIPAVIWDEIHVINFINRYIDGLYHNDVSPPLSKIIYTFVAYLLGYRGETVGLNRPGDSYIGEAFPFVGLRVFTVILSSLTVVVFYVTLRKSTVNFVISNLVSLLVIFENLITLESRIFVNDTLFLFALSLTVLTLKNFKLSEIFSKNWIKYLFLIGILLGLSISIKWVGVLTLVWVLALSLIDFLKISQDLTISNIQVFKHSASKLSSFIFLPILIYIGVFAIHILLTPNYHSDAALLSSEFQTQLDFNPLQNIPKYVTFGSTVTIRHEESLGGFLHSHDYDYESGSRNQQVTAFDYKDINNEWVIEPNGPLSEDDDLRVKSFQQVKLRHKTTGKLLRVTDFKPPVSEQEYNFEVSCYGNSTFDGDEHDIFSIEFDGDYLKSMDTKFKLFNFKKSCTLLSHDFKLPEWGFGQQEVICITTPTFSRTLFRIEELSYPEDHAHDEKYKEQVSKVEVSFFQKFIELNNLIYRLLTGLKDSRINSNGEQWIQNEGNFTFYGKDGKALYLSGNSLNFFTVLGGLVIASILVVRQFFQPTKDLVLEYELNELFSYILAFVIHLAISKGYLFNYLPSLYFGFLALGVLSQYFYNQLHKVVLISLIALISFSFINYSKLTPVTFGLVWSRDACSAFNESLPCELYN
ncbi:hypothetical protein WICMUC_002100 [Wickerhamomyces mucosus]|uniref:Dolichyl-phosphate-mannose--protein mannosyltransferase n=1 Tax=Wickerhamomyces mucosus TaxID=1378264 RepID=A0A9P8PS50_9ASCO|nr:hypothetical protein WICMUC_002100 [Wickerhamomyces mucosus]